MRTYTGPTMGGGRATVQCPPWCVTDHAYWGDMVDDMFHHSEELSVMPPGAPDPLSTRHQVPQLLARLTVHSTDPRPAGATVLMSLSEHYSEGVDLDVAGVDKLLAELDAYRTKLAGLRDLLAGIHQERAERAG